MTPPKPIADVHTCHATCPCQPSKLGPLEFKAEDFWEEGISTNAAKIAVVIANRILAERLKKAPEVFLTKGYGHYDKWIEDESELDAEPTHRARLVCIEKLEGK